LTLVGLSTGQRMIGATGPVRTKALGVLPEPPAFTGHSLAFAHWHAYELPR
jgi:hypothetical protein